ncbi:MAG: hypothetical protein LC776_01060 [Acidobacteria bacterium]|nr:hypothetical protein [Acidobacteriota bacterium]
MNAGLKGCRSAGGDSRNFGIPDVPGSFRVRFSPVRRLLFGFHSRVDGYEPRAFEGCLTRSGPELVELAARVRLLERLSMHVTGAIMSLRPVLLAAALIYPAVCAAQALQELRIDMTSATTAVPKELEVDDWSRARVTVTKNMFHSCTVETKTEALPAPPNPVAQILSVLQPGESLRPRDDRA